MKHITLLIIIISLTVITIFLSHTANKQLTTQGNSKPIHNFNFNSQPAIDVPASNFDSDNHTYTDNYGNDNKPKSTFSINATRQTTDTETIKPKSSQLTLYKNNCENYLRDSKEPQDELYTSQGFWLNEPNSKEKIDYYQYDIEELHTLAESGDAAAQHILGEKYKNSNTGKAVYWYKQAAINGYVMSLFQLSGIIAEQTKAAKSAQNNVEQTIYNSTVLEVTTSETPSAHHHGNQKIENQASIEIHAWFLVAMKRLGFNTKNLLTMNNKDKSTRKQYRAAYLLAEESYTELQQARRQRGLGDFKNVAPKPYRAMMSEQYFKCLKIKNIK